MTPFLSASPHVRVGRVRKSRFRASARGIGSLFNCKGGNHAVDWDAEALDVARRFLAGFVP